MYFSVQSFHQYGHLCPCPIRFNVFVLSIHLSAPCIFKIDFPSNLLPLLWVKLEYHVPRLLISAPKAEEVTEKEKKWSVRSMANLIQLSYPWASLEMKGFERREWLSFCVDCRSVWLTHVLICRLPLQPTLHTLEPARSKGHILIIAVWARLRVDRPRWNQTHILSERAVSVEGSPTEPIHISVAELLKCCRAIE